MGNICKCSIELLNQEKKKTELLSSLGLRQWRKTSEHNVDKQAFGLTYLFLEERFLADLIHRYAPAKDTVLPGDSKNYPLVLRIAGVIASDWMYLGSRLPYRTTPLVLILQYRALCRSGLPVSKNAPYFSYTVNTVSGFRNRTVFIVDPEAAFMSSSTAVTSSWTDWIRIDQEFREVTEVIEIRRSGTVLQFFRNMNTSVVHSRMVWLWMLIIPCVDVALRNIV